jgi:hypothetical protein
MIADECSQATNAERGNYTSCSKHAPGSRMSNQSPQSISSNAGYHNAAIRTGSGMNIA